MSDLTIYQAEVQARADALTGASSEALVREVGIAANVVETRGGDIDRTILDVQLQRIADDVTGASSNAELISTGAALPRSSVVAGQNVVPFGMVAPFAENGTNFTDVNGVEWLKTGYTTTALSSYPDAVRTPVPNNTFTTRTATGTTHTCAVYSEPLGKFFVGSAGRINSSTDGDTWTQVNTGFTPSNIITLPSGKLLAFNSSTAYIKSDDGVTWSHVAGNPIGPTRAVVTSGEYWYACNSSQSGWGQGNVGNITPVTVASGSAWADIAYSPSLRRLVMVGTNLCQTNEAAYAGTWTIRTISGQPWLSVIWVEDFGLFIAVGGAGAFATSPDGITWTARPNLLGVNLSNLTYCSEIRTLYCFSSTGASLYTQDGLAWVQNNTVVGSGAVNGAAWGRSTAKGLVVAAASSIYKNTPTQVVGTTQKLALGAGVPYYTRIK